MDCTELVEHHGYAARSVVRHKDGAPQAAVDNVAEELPVALVYNGISHAVMMATPLDLEAFAVGFSLTEGIVSRNEQIHDLEVRVHAHSAEVQLQIGEQAFAAMKARRRALAGRTGCGVCGIESLELLDLEPAPMRAPARRLQPTREMIARAAAALPSHQRLMRETGGVHAAAWCDARGEILHVFEDVGRHNGLDKLIGHLAMQRVAMDDGFVFLSSRASYELVRKAARMNIQMLATISAPTSLAIRIAGRAGLRLLSFCRKDGYVDYTDAACDTDAERAMAGARAC
ncbi:formate dehydrogenase accessory sulfurtransferase FdhD [Cupriavidus sp. WKF15]|uniref:formate dehydrogenase accessory sulfurtransferase FdhD n=1 Tax=Cupriavidus sp. WKF15 TaxID=3032282 RepID=UPI0023E245E7|nr:formate dehydrogenase accessory sulfurtransferase FdhD [Cupriavidus sp. WKF15]WER48443.1 formate dehydrogenase accessory sulfurtransferase FdhD [Cupriavidus sp. WKF15]